MRIAYAYPWDIAGDPTAPDRLAALGVEAVALAASYHSTRAATPYHPAHRILDVPHSAFYLPVRPAAWGRLTPASPTWTTPDAYLVAQDALRRAGLRVYAWTVLTHNAHLGGAHPDLVVRNAFGDAYPYALCPAFEDVAEYCSRLVREVLTAGEPDGLILEGCGPMGFAHQGVHEKTSGADFDADLLSLCFCTACAGRYPEGTRDRIRTAIDNPPTPAHPAPHSPSSLTERPSPAYTAERPSPPSATEHPSPPATPERLSPPSGSPTTERPLSAIDTVLGPLADDVRAARVALSASLRNRLISTAREVAPNVPITLHANPDPWATGPFAALPTGEPGADVLVGNCWGDPATDAARLTRLRDLCAAGQRVGAYVLALPPRSADPADLAEHLTTYAKAGASEIHLYHAGLAGPERLAAMTAALRQTNL